MHGVPATGLHTSILSHRVTAASTAAVVGIATWWTVPTIAAIAALAIGGTVMVAIKLRRSERHLQRILEDEMDGDRDLPTDIHVVPTFIRDDSRFYQLGR